MTEEQQRTFIAERIFARISGKGERRSEALRAFLDLTMPTLDEKTVAGMAAAIPELPPSLYRKWIGLFIDRLLETAPAAQITDLCQGTAESDASLLLVYIMFMESARMEKVVAEDLKALGKDDAPEAAEAWLRLHAASPIRH